MCHSFDTKTKDIRSATVRLIKKRNNGELGFFSSLNIHASIKDQYYTTYTAVTNDKLLTAECTYKAGGYDEQKSVCVHILVPLS